MTMFDAAFTDDDYTTLIHILHEWEMTGLAEQSIQRNERATLLKAKLILQRNAAHVDRMFESMIPQNTAQQTKMELAEQYKRECGIGK